jgi:hypothetical protein
VSKSTVRRWRDPDLAVRQVRRGRERAVERAAEQAQRLFEVAQAVTELAPRGVRGRYLSLAERLVIADLRVLG